MAHVSLLFLYAIFGTLNLTKVKLNLNNYSAIIFDLGGVILNLDYHRSVMSFEKLGIHNVQNLFSQKKQVEVFNQFETGQISPEEFRSFVQSYSGKNVPSDTIDHAWNQMLLDLPLARFQLLQNISKQKRTFLLSNTNAIHMDWFSKYTDKLLGKNSFFETFEVAYLSHQINMRKPHPEIFEFVISENNLNPVETLFIDDSEQHIIGAKKTGLQTHWLQPGEDILNLF